MRTSFKATLTLAAAAVAAYSVALVNMKSPTGETWSDIGNAAMLTPCCLCLWALHLTPSERTRTRG